jgi:hypothetical protein
MTHEMIQTMVPVAPIAPRGARWAAAVAIWLIRRLQRKPA